MTPRRCWQSGLLLLALLVLLAGCGGGQSAHTSATPTTKAAAATATPQPTATATLVPCSRAMDPVQFGTQTFYQPHDPCVGAAMQALFVAFWAWAGYQPPTRFPFLPDATQIPQYATASYAPQLESYIQQVQASGQLTSYSGQPSPQAIEHCLPDGSQCSVSYGFNVGMTKTVYTVQTGAVVSQQSGSRLALNVAVVQVYTEESAQWLINALQIQEVSF